MPSDPRYPIGKFEEPKSYTPEVRAKLINEIASLPVAMRGAVLGLSDAQLDTPYRDGGWTVRQVVHHVADSHMNANIRMRLALTAELPTVPSYDESKWAELVDARSLPVEVSLSLLDALHHRWTTLMRALTDDQLHRQYNHSENGKTPLQWVLAQYAWHGRHHTAQITALRAAKRW